jgi:Protein of unknown function (DUF3489)
MQAGSFHMPTVPGQKRDAVLRLLRRRSGATMEDLRGATGWLPYTIRGYLSGYVRKRMGFAVVREKNAAGEFTYRVSDQ